MPQAKSRYSLPSSSHTRVPSARATDRWGCATARPGGTAWVRHAPSDRRVEESCAMNPRTIIHAMHRTTRLFVLFVAALLVPGTAWATWSVIAVDLATKRVVIASATCVDRDD